MHNAVLLPRSRIMRVKGCKPWWEVRSGLGERELGNKNVD